MLENINHRDTESTEIGEEGFKPRMDAEDDDAGEWGEGLSG